MMPIQEYPSVGAFLAGTSRRGNAGFTRARRGQSVGEFIKIIKAGNARNSY